MITTYELLNEELKGLVDKAKAVMPNAYNPYSKYFVGAAVLTDKGSIYCGCNFENAAYGSTICAERNAIGTMIANGEYRPVKIAIVSKGETFDAKEPVVPCGSCLQVMNEMAQISGGLEVMMCNTKLDKIEILNIAEILQRSFGPNDLGADVAKYRK
jgi:cytidine deaminase